MTNNHLEKAEVNTLKKETGCCGGTPIADNEACCVADEEAKLDGRSGCGCDCSSSSEME